MTESMDFTPEVIGKEYLDDPDLRDKLWFGVINDQAMVRGIAVNLCIERARSQERSKIARGLLHQCLLTMDDDGWGDIQYDIESFLGIGVYHDD